VDFVLDRREFGDSLSHKGLTNLITNEN